LNECEVEVIKIVGRYFGIEKPVGYIASGGTEGNLAGIWWGKRYLRIRGKPVIQAMRQELSRITEEEALIANAVETKTFEQLTH
jgi:glutamate/tyrosine decarboxylase-like PLP-dependent enzyme